MSDGSEFFIATLVIQALFGIGALYVVERVKHAARGAVDEAVGRALTEQQHQYDLRMEVLRLEKDRLLQSSGLYTSRRHDVYARLYGYLVKADGLLSEFYGFSMRSDFSQADRHSIEDYLDNVLGVSKPHKEEVLQIWDTDRPKAQETLGQMEMDHKKGTAREAFTRAKNYALLNALYLTPEVTAAVRDVIQAMSRLVTGLIPSLEVTGTFEASKDAGRKLGTLRDILQTELRQGLSPLAPPSVGG